MNMNHSFKAERRAALHCAAVLKRCSFVREPEVANLEPVWASIAAQLEKSLGQVCGSTPKVSVSEASTKTSAESSEEMSGDFNHGLIEVGVSRARALTSLDSAAAFILLDQALGGRGVAPAVLPSSLPRSAQLMISQIHSAFAAAMALALGINTTNVQGGVLLSTASPFKTDAALTSILFTVAPVQGQPWQMRLTMEQAETGELLNSASSQNGSSALHRQGPSPADPTSKPYAEIPITIRAVLVDTHIPVVHIAQLQIGQVLPVAVARHVPLWADRIEIGRGSIGSIDDRVALKITTSLHSQKDLT